MEKYFVKSVGTLHIEILQQAHVCLCVFNSGCIVLIYQILFAFSTHGLIHNN